MVDEFLVFNALSNELRRQGFPCATQAGQTARSGESVDVSALCKEVMRAVDRSAPATGR